MSKINFSSFDKKQLSDEIRCWLKHLTKLQTVHIFVKATFWWRRSLIGVPYRVAPMHEESSVRSEKLWQLNDLHCWKLLTSIVRNFWPPFSVKWRWRWPIHEDFFAIFYSWYGDGGNMTNYNQITMDTVGWRWYAE